MISYIIRRLLYMVPLVLGVTLITFLLFNIAGGNPVYQILGKHASESEIREMSHQLGLDKPILVQYVNYLGELAKFDFGRSWTTHQKISSMILDGLGPTLMLAIPSFILASILAIIIALIAAFFRNHFIDRTLVFISILGMSISALVYIIAGQYFLSYAKDIFPISGYENGLAAIPYLVLPGLIWIIIGLGSDVRFFRTVILNEVNREYVITARAKGVSERVIMAKHVLKNSLIPIITTLAMALPSLFAGSLLLETFFNIPGLGNLGINAINDSDLPVIKALTFFGSLLYMLGNLLGDILYSVADPRVRLK